jgi:hypothetical protein
MAILDRLPPKEYEYKQDGAYKLMNLPHGQRYGLIAQDVEEVLPSLVKATTFDTRYAKHETPQSGKAPAGNPVAKLSEKIEFKA